MINNLICRSSEDVFWTCDGKPHPGSQFRHGYIDSPLRNKSISTTPPKERDYSIVKEEKMFEMFNILLKKVENIETKLDFQESKLESRSEPEVKNDDTLDSSENSTLQQEIFNKEVIINELRSQNNDLKERLASLEMKTSKMEKDFQVKLKDYEKNEQKLLEENTSLQSQCKHHEQALEQLNQSLAKEKRFNETNLHSSAEADPKIQEIEFEEFNKSKYDRLVREHKETTFHLDQMHEQNEKLKEVLENFIEDLATTKIHLDTYMDYNGKWGKCSHDLKAMAQVPTDMAGSDLEFINKHLHYLIQKI